MKKKPVKKREIKNNEIGLSNKKDRLEVILEEINGKFDIISEGYTILKDGQDKMRDEMTSFKGETEANFKAVFEYLINIDDEIVKIKKEIKEIKEELKLLKLTLDKKADKEKVKSMEGRIVKMELRVKSIETKQKQKV